MNYPNGQMTKAQTKAKVVVKAVEIHRKATIVKFQT